MLRCLGDVARDQGAPERAIACYEESLTLYRTLYERPGLHLADEHRYEEEVGALMLRQRDLTLSLGVLSLLPVVRRSLSRLWCVTLGGRGGARSTHQGTTPFSS